MVSKITNRGLALKRGGRMNYLLLPMGIVSRAKTGGEYGKMRGSQKVTEERKWAVLTVPILPGEARVEDPTYRMKGTTRGGEGG